MTGPTNNAFYDAPRILGDCKISFFEDIRRVRTTDGRFGIYGTIPFVSIRVLKFDYVFKIFFFLLYRAFSSSFLYEKDTLELRSLQDQSKSKIKKF